jgi:hypothetical protein
MCSIFKSCAINCLQCFPLCPVRCSLSLTLLLFSVMSLNETWHISFIWFAGIPCISVMPEELPEQIQPCICIFCYLSHSLTLRTMCILHGKAIIILTVVITVIVTHSDRHILMWMSVSHIRRRSFVSLAVSLEFLDVSEDEYLIVMVNIVQSISNWCVLL